MEVISRIKRAWAPRRRAAPRYLVELRADRPAGRDIAMVAASDAPTAAPDWRFRLLLGVSLAALLLGALDLALIAGAGPFAGARFAATGTGDPATYGFEGVTDGWRTKGAASGLAVTTDRAFAGRGALRVQLAGVSAARNAFAFASDPQTGPGTLVVAHLYVPAGAPRLLASIYALDGSWGWHNGQFVGLTPDHWTAVTFQLDAGTPSPMHELGVMLVGAQRAPAYSGPVYLDSVDLQSH